MTTAVKLNRAAGRGLGLGLLMLANLVAAALVASACESDGATPNCPTDANSEGVLDPGNPCLTGPGDVLVAQPVEAGAD